MKFALWIHCLTQAILAATLVFYFEELQGYFHHLAEGYVNFMGRLPIVTYYAINWRSIFWLTPITFLAGAFAIQRRGCAPDTYAIFNACSVLAIVALIGFAVLATCAPFWWGQVISQP